MLEDVGTNEHIQKRIEELKQEIKEIEKDFWKKLTDRRFVDPITVLFGRRKKNDE